ncbi:hypothetical protein QZH41_016919, partial [Actinostola sp. cb2023]
MIKVPRLRACYIAKLVHDDLSSPRKLQQDFEQPSLLLSTVVTKQTHWHKTGSFTNTNALSDRMTKMCEGYPIYSIVRTNRDKDVQ